MTDGDGHIPYAGGGEACRDIAAPLAGVALYAASPERATRIAGSASATRTRVAETAR